MKKFFSSLNGNIGPITLSAVFGLFFWFIINPAAFIIIVVRQHLAEWILEAQNLQSANTTSSAVICILSTILFFFLIKFAIKCYKNIIAHQRKKKMKKKVAKPEK